MREALAAPATAEAARLGALDRLRQVRYRGERVEWSAYLFVLPFLVLYVTFLVLPLIFGAYVSFTEWGIVGDPVWVGLKNVQRALADDWVPKVWGNTIRFALMVVPAVVVLALGMALFVNSGVWAAGLARTLFFAPHVVAVTVTSLIWVWMLEKDLGFLNLFLEGLGLPKVPWLTNPSWALLAIAAATVWWAAGFHMVILLAGLQDIPRELREAAVVDGATRWRVFTAVIVPLLRPALSLVITLEMIAAMRVFGQVHLMTGGGPAGASASIVSYIYEVGFRKYELGYAAVISLLLFLTLLVFTVIHLRLFKESLE